MNGNPSVQEAPQTPPGAPPAAAPQYPARPCAECLTPFRPRAFNQLFCTPAHREAWNSRVLTRGKQLLPFAMVARVTRDGTRGSAAAIGTGRAAASDAALLIQRWRDEDRAASRMEWPEYLRRRYAAGFDPI